jgi:hypothetical protein
MKLFLAAACLATFPTYALAQVRIDAVIPPTSNRRFPTKFDRDTYK